MMHWLVRMTRHTDVVLAIAVLGIIAVLVIPVPPIWGYWQAFVLLFLLSEQQCYMFL